jgi:hypothetical protein
MGITVPGCPMSRIAGYTKIIVIAAAILTSTKNVTFPFIILRGKLDAPFEVSRQQPPSLRLISNPASAPRGH